MRLLWFVLSCLLSACATSKQVPNRFVVEKRWVRSTVAGEYLGGRRVHRFSPLISEHSVIAANGIDGIVAFDRRTADLKWRLNLKDGVEGGAQLVEGVLYFGAGDGQFYAVEEASGRVLWNYPIRAEGLSRPLVRDNVVYFLAGNNVAHAIEAQTGKLVWLYNRRDTSNLSIRGGSRPALDGDLIYIGFSDGAFVALNRRSGTVVWEVLLNKNKRFRDVDAGPIIDRERIYVSGYDGALFCLNKSDGKILWTYDEGGYDDVAIDGQNLYYSTTSGKVVALDKTSGKVVWTFADGKGVGTGPTLYKNVLAYGEMTGALRVLDTQSGRELGSFQSGRGVTSVPTIDSKTGDLYFVSAEANLFTLHVAWRRWQDIWSWEQDSND